MSEVFWATSFTSCAPTFSVAFASSISLATVTPSLVMVGDPNFFSITTLRPLGPSVAFTASASMLTPRRIACRESSPCRICFAIVLLLLPAHWPVEMFVLHRRKTRLGCLSPRESAVENSAKHLLLHDAQDFLFAHDQELVPVQLDLGARVLAEQDRVARLHVQREDLALVVRLALAHGDHFALLRLLFGCIRNDDAAANALDL